MFLIVVQEGTENFLANGCRFRLPRFVIGVQEGNTQGEPNENTILSDSDAHRGFGCPAGRRFQNQLVVQRRRSLARLKTLVGQWEATTSSGKVHLTYELVSGDTALLERESSDTMPSMVTVYYVDGGRLLLTHYCMAGNQPRMQAKAFNADTGDLDFQFLDATNLASPGAGHMHNVKIHIVDNSHLASEWQFYENGKPKFSEAAQYTRVQ